MTRTSMIWTDLETTGLAAEFEVPLELGIVLTDEHGNAIAEKSWLVYEKDYHDAITYAQRHPIVGPMHRKSGLWFDLEEIDFGCRTTREDVDNEACEFLQAHGVKFGTLGLAGNSVGSLDRPFIIIHFPKLNEALGYRNIDMSSIKEIMKRVNPGLYDNLKPVIENKEAATHRVLSDCHAAIAEYRAYLDEFLIVADDF